MKVLTWIVKFLTIVSQVSVKLRQISVKITVKFLRNFCENLSWAFVIVSQSLLQVSVKIQLNFYCLWKFKLSNSFS